MASQFYLNNGDMELSEKLKSPKQEERDDGFLSPLNFSNLGASAVQEDKDKNYDMISPKQYNDRMDLLRDTLRKTDHLMPVNKYSHKSGNSTSVKTDFSESHLREHQNSHKNSSTANQVLDQEAPLDFYSSNSPFKMRQEIAPVNTPSDNSSDEIIRNPQSRMSPSCRLTPECPQDAIPSNISPMANTNGRGHLFKMFHGRPNIYQAKVLGDSSDSDQLDSPTL